MNIRSWRSARRAKKAAAAAARAEAEALAEALADARAAEQLSTLRTLVRSINVRNKFQFLPQAYVVHVLQVYQRARDGAKAIVDVEGVGQRDAWFWWGGFVADGQTLAVQAGRAWGPHNSIDDVFYIGSAEGANGVYDLLHPGTAARAWRHEQHPSIGAGSGGTDAAPPLQLN